MQDIRITSGKFRGRSIKSPNLKTTHPMGAREKLALFNMISEFLPGAIVLDIYAGSGALGIEALSRGAKYVTFVEKNPRAAAVIRKNLISLSLLGCGEVLKQDASNFLSDKKFDIIIADPPYDSFQPDVLSILTDYLDPTGVLMLSHPSEAPDIPGLMLAKTHAYAAAHLSLYRLVGA